MTHFNVTCETCRRRLVLEAGSEVHLRLRLRLGCWHVTGEGREMRCLCPRCKPAGELSAVADK